jgi:uncharacterized protein (DUF362 family)
MTFSRRDFLKAIPLAGGAVILDRRRLLGYPRTPDFYGLNGFIESHADAVFVLRTSVDAKTNAPAIKSVGQQLGRTLFVPKSDPMGGYPIATNVAIKPNLTSWSWDKAPIEQVMGIQTDANFVEGIIGSLGELSIDAEHIYIRDGNFSASQSDGVLYKGLAQRTGVNLKDLSAGVGGISSSDIQWTAVSNGSWFNRIAHLWPVNSPASCLLNIAKFKSHSMGMTLCSKNLQGTNAQPYIAHCTAWGKTMQGVNAQDVVPNAFATIKANYDRHNASGIPRWDLPGESSGGLWMETHASRCLDNNSVLHPLLNIIEGVYGREGPFVSGPSPDGYGIDVMSNIVIFGKNALHVDIVGTYLAGHEPGNFGLFHMALERGLSKYLNPTDIPLFEWKLDGSAAPAQLSAFTRTPIRTLYLRKAGEAQYHMVDERYDYSGVTAVNSPKREMPDAFVIYQNFPNPFNPTTSIQYYLPRAGNVRLEVFNIQGELVDLLEDGFLPAGDHVKVWKSDHRPSGTYFYRMSNEGFSTTKAMVVIK